MKTLLAVPLVLLAVLVAVGGVFALVAFSRYCDEVAKFYGRTKERHDHWGADENGQNAFEREQYWNLLLGRNKFSGDPAIERLGNRTANGFRMLVGASAILLVCVVGFFDG